MSEIKIKNLSNHPQIEVKLHNKEDMIQLCRIVNKYDFDSDLLTESRNGIIDAKSILGVLSLGLGHTYYIVAHTDDEQAKPLFEEIEQLNLNLLQKTVLKLMHGDLRKMSIEQNLHNVKKLARLI